LENKPDQELNEDEKNEAWNSYLAELQGNRYQLQNNNPNANNQGLGTFGKSPISADFLKLYQDMVSQIFYSINCTYKLKKKINFSWEHRQIMEI
jgi:hypothetical protein